MKYIDIDLKICFEDNVVLYHDNNASKLESAISELFDDILGSNIDYIKTEAKVKGRVE